MKKDKRGKIKEEISLSVMEIIGYANAVMIDEVGVDKHRYFNTKASDVVNRIDLLLSQLD